MLFCCKQLERELDVKIQKSEQSLRQNTHYNNKRIQNECYGQKLINPVCSTTLLTTRLTDHSKCFCNILYFMEHRRIKHFQIIKFDSRPLISLTHSQCDHYDYMRLINADSADETVWLIISGVCSNQNNYEPTRILTYCFVSNSLRYVFVLSCM